MIPVAAHLTYFSASGFDLKRGARPQPGGRSGKLSRGFLENATVRGRDWYKLLDAPVLTLDVTVRGETSAGRKISPTASVTYLRRARM